MDVQSEQNPNAEWPSNTRFTSYKMYAYLVKHLDPLRPEVNWTAGSRNVFVYRLADTYLLAAEAAFLSGNAQKAAEYINVVRRRAAVPGHEAEMEIKSSDVTIDFILDERARELMGEMHRWYDLKRTDKLMERMNDPEISPMTAGKFKDYHVLRPIPRDQLTNVFESGGIYPESWLWQLIILESIKMRVYVLLLTCLFFLVCWVNPSNRG